MLDPAIHDPFRDVISPLQEAGSVVAWKALGAGGGGSVGLLCSPMGVSTTVSAIEQAGWEVIEWDYEDKGMQVK